jgi:hypothetical protein
VTIDGWGTRTESSTPQTSKVDGGPRGRRKHRTPSQGDRPWFLPLLSTNAPNQQLLRRLCLGSFFRGLWNWLKVDLTSILESRHAKIDGAALGSLFSPPRSLTGCLVIRPLQVLCALACLLELAIVKFSSTKKHDCGESNRGLPSCNRFRLKFPRSGHTRGASSSRCRVDMNYDAQSGVGWFYSHFILELCLPVDLRVVSDLHLEGLD